MAMAQLDLIGVNDAARMLRVSPATVHRWTSEGRLKLAGTVGRRNVRVYTRSDVNDLVEEREKKWL